MKFATLLAAVAAGSIAAPAMAQDRDPAEDFNGPYIAIGGGASLQPNDSGETLLFDADGDGNYGDTVRDANGADVFSPGFCGGRATGTANRGCAHDRDGAEYFGRIGMDRPLGNFLVGALNRGGPSTPQAQLSASLPHADAYYLTTPA